MGTVNGAFGYDLSSGKQVFCDVTWDGAPTRIKEEYIGGNDDTGTVNNLGGSAALVRYPEGREPIIVFDRKMMTRIKGILPLATDFIFFHECAHIRYKTSDEFYANCRAVVDMHDAGLLEKNDFILLGKYHKSRRVLPVKYGGAGYVFWERTKECLRQIKHPLVRNSDN